MMVAFPIPGFPVRRIFSGRAVMVELYIINPIHEYTNNILRIKEADHEELPEGAMV